MALAQCQIQFAPTPLCRGLLPLIPAQRGYRTRDLQTASPSTVGCQPPLLTRTSSEGSGGADCLKEPSKEETAGLEVGTLHIGASPHCSIMKTVILFIIVSLAHVTHQFPVPLLEDQETGFALQETAASPEDPPQFQIVELPSEFNTYDMNVDGAISLDELSDITETRTDDAALPFHNADKDGNDLLTKQEFEDAPWVFSIPEGIIL